MGEEKEIKGIKGIDSHLRVSRKHKLTSCRKKLVNGMDIYKKKWVQH